MKIFNVLWKDRHSDTTATPFGSFEVAKKWAKKQAEEYCKHPEDFEERDIGRWLYYVRYSCEGDCLWITEHDIQP